MGRINENNILTKSIKMKVQFRRNSKCYLFFTEWAYVAKEFEKERPYVVKMSHKDFRVTVCRCKTKPPITNLMLLSLTSIVMYYTAFLPPLCL